MQLLKSVVDTIEKITEFLGWLSQMIVPITILVGFGNVVLRYVGEFVGLQLTSNAFIELQWYLYTLIFFFGFAYILKNGINVRVDFWFANQPPKRKAWIDFVGHLLALVPFCLLALYVTWNPVLTSLGRLPDGSWPSWVIFGDYLREGAWNEAWRAFPGETSPDPNGLPRAPIKSMILVAFATLLLQTVAELIKLYAVLRDQVSLFKLEESEAPLRIE